MNKYIGTALLCAGAIACGAAEDQDDTEEIGELVQELVAQAPKWGVSTSGSHMACDNVNTSQVCHVPRANNMTYCYGDLASAFTAQEKATFENAVSVFNAAQLKFRYTKVNLTPAACLQLPFSTNVVVKKFSTGSGIPSCSGSSSSGNIDAYVCFATRGINSVTESVPGSWFSHFGGDITYDATDIAASTALGQECLPRHGFLHALAGIAGIGADATASDAFNMSARSTTPFKVNLGAGQVCGHNSLTVQQKCAADNYSVQNPGQFSFTGASGC